MKISRHFLKEIEKHYEKSVTAKNFPNFQTSRLFEK